MQPAASNDFAAKVDHFGTLHHPWCGILNRPFQPVVVRLIAAARYYGTLVHMILGPVPLRVLGALIEKEITTPEAYPLSLNALLNACNQRSSRDPVLDLDEEQVRQGLHTLEDLELATAVRDTRVPKYEHRARTVLNLRRDETAILCLLLLRGPQTSGELRSRADRLFAFDDLAAVQATLDRLASRAPAASDAPETTTAGPLTVMLPRQPGSRESRYMHLLGGPPAQEAFAATSQQSTPVTSTPSRLADIEAELAELRSQLASLASRVAELESKV